MTGRTLKRRTILKGLALTSFVPLSGCVSSRGQKSAGRVVVLGGGFGGARAAAMLKTLAPELQVMLIEANDRYVSCPFSNLVIAHRRSLSQQTFFYDGLQRRGVAVVRGTALGIDAVLKRIDLDTGEQVFFDRLILAPGISFDYEAMPGLSEAAALKMPHAWKAGAQTTLLAKQLQDLRDGGLVVISVPRNPYRCPPGPYERASLIARYLKAFKPRSKLLVLDAKDQFSKQKLFQTAWQEKYGSLIEWQGLSDGAAVTRVDPETMTVATDFDVLQADVANIIPEQKAGTIALTSGIADATGWCPVDALTFESTMAAGIHVIGDAAILNAMPKSAFSANAQAKLCAVQVVRALKGLPPLDITLANTCYSLVDDNYGISVAGVYRAEGEAWKSVPGSGGTSPLHASPKVRALEAEYAADWFRAITQETFL